VGWDLQPFGQRKPRALLRVDVPLQHLHLLLVRGHQPLVLRIVVHLHKLFL
jgi:hypothetical protein